MDWKVCLIASNTSFISNLHKNVNMNWKTPLLVSLHYSWAESSIATTPPDSLHVIVNCGL